MSKQLILSFIFIAFASTAWAQRARTVEAEYTYYAPENVTLEEARQTSLERAKLQAIAAEFGSNVQQFSTSRVENANGKTHVEISRISGSEVKGEWIETLGDPQYDISYEQGMLVVTCRVKGKAREIAAAQIDFRALVLRNGVDDRYESDQFKSGDDLYLSFQSPVGGYLAVYLMDAERQAFCLLPYQSQTDGIYRVEANRRYVFFNAREAPAAERSMVDEYTMTCERQSEHNQVYVIFSPNQFAKATDVSTSEGLPRQLGYDDFQHWLAKCRKRDTRMTLRMIPLVVNK